MRSGLGRPLTVAEQRPGRQFALHVDRVHGMTDSRRQRRVFSILSDNRNTGTGVRCVGFGPVAAAQAQQRQKRTSSGDEV